mmetsp:Transcript_104226/g.204440  ORF Transcript_104226/g.204440 Transcript_104226/m.204440 type:complete len:489 (-) Transcript_104226:116-1582(-)
MILSFPSKSRVEICGANRHECGYCKASQAGRKESSISYGVISKVMTVEDYQNMMLVGWRRSGTYYYKPTMHKTCCSQYPIRLNVEEFKPSKSQKKTLKTVEKYLNKSDGDDTASVSTEDNLKLSSEFTMNYSSVLPAEAVGTPTSTHNQTAMNHGSTKQITIEMDEAKSTPEKYDLYRRYQMAVHKDAPEEVKESGFKRFLADSSLVDNSSSPRPAACLIPSTNHTPTFRYGTFHMLYRLNGKLIAVGVVDLLPLGLSSVYVFYDNDYKHLALGKYTALKEIEFCKLHGFKFYFMGFYIHSCEKMKYKGEYKPSELLCPTTLQWYPLHEHCINILDKFRFSPFEPSLAAQRALLPIDVGVSESEESKGSTKSSECVSNPNPNENCTDNSITISGQKRSNAIENISEHNALEELEAFSPHFFSTPDRPNSDAPTLSHVLVKAPLDIGTPNPVGLLQLQAKSVQHLRPYLTEWLEQVGPHVGSTVALSLT